MKPRFVFLLYAILIIGLVILAYLQYAWTGEVVAVERDRMEKSMEAAAENIVADFNRLLDGAGSRYSSAILKLKPDRHIPTDTLMHMLHDSDTLGLAKVMHEIVRSQDAITFRSLYKDGTIIQGTNTDSLSSEVQYIINKALRQGAIGKNSSKFKGSLMGFSPLFFGFGVVSQVYFGRGTYFIHFYENAESDVKIQGKLYMVEADQKQLKEALIPNILRTYLGADFQDRFLVYLMKNADADSVYFSVDVDQPRIENPEVRVKVRNADIESVQIFSFNISNSLSATVRLQVDDQSGAILPPKPPSLTNIKAALKAIDQGATTADSKKPFVEWFSTDSSVMDSIGLDKIPQELIESITIEKDSLNSNLSVAMKRAFDNGKTLKDKVGFFANTEKASMELWLSPIQGSLDAFVRQTQFRNLGVGFFILMVLALAGTMLIYYTNRSSRLAQQQMLFVAGVSHELRTPISVIYSAAENMNDGVVTEIEGQKKYFRLIMKEGKRLSGMVEQIMEFAGFQSGKVKNHFETVGVEEFFREVISEIQQSLSKEETLTYFIASGLGEMCLDKDGIRRVLINLISNAFKFNRENHAVLLRLYSGSLKNDPALVIEVEDQGTGIPKEEQKLIFEPFYRGKKPIADQARGYGIGLNLVKRIVEHHSGDIQVRSKKGLGSKFVVFLPKTIST